MKQTLLLMMLALGMCSINVGAQTKKYKVESDGYEWYCIIGDKGSGAMNKYGKTIVPAQYTMVEYQNEFFKVWKHEGGFDKYGFYDTDGNLLVPVEYSNGFGWPNGIIIVEDGEFVGVYNKYGKCIIPTFRGYRDITPSGKTPYSYYLCRSKSINEESNCTYSICDASGKVVFTTFKEYKRIKLMRDNSSGKYALGVLTDHWYFVNLDEKTLWDPQCYTIQGSEFKIQKSKDGAWRNITPQEKNRILFSADLLKGNTDYFAHASEQPMQRIDQNGQSNGGNNGTAHQQQSGGTTTVVVEHHRDPIPVQEWQQCPACYGSGQCPNVSCGGSGWYYIGDRATTCSRCHGSGKCTICAGRGGQNVTVYR